MELGVSLLMKPADSAGVAVVVLVVGRAVDRLM
jgi:hypothetical protein